MKQCSCPLSAWQVSSGQHEQPDVTLVLERPGDRPAAKLETPGSRASGIRSPLVSTATGPASLAGTISVRLHGKGMAEKVMLCVSSSFRASLFRGGFRGM